MAPSWRGRAPLFALSALLLAASASVLGCVSQTEGCPRNCSPGKPLCDRSAPRDHPPQRCPPPPLPCRAVGQEPTVHTVFSTQCTPYFDWQSIVLKYSFDKAGQPGKLTRLVSCKPEERERVRRERPQMFDIVENTFVTDDVEENTRVGDFYSAYNRPYSMMKWLESPEAPQEDVLLIIDADMVFREPITPSAVGAKRGAPVAAFYGYMKGVANELAETMIPEVPPVYDTVAGPSGRKADQVGCFFAIYKDDFAKIAEDYMSFTEKVRLDPNAWHTSGDVYTEKAGRGRPWIAEMYGWVFAAARGGLHHQVDPHTQMYPGYPADVAPRILHYGILWEIGKTGFMWDKHWFRDFDPLKCPPWENQPWEGAFGQDNVPKSGLFPKPPSPKEFKTTGKALLTDLLSIEPVIIADAALCWWYDKSCPRQHEQLQLLCEGARQRERELDERYASLGDLARSPRTRVVPACVDKQPSECRRWASTGECDKNPTFMHDACQKSCGLCGGENGGETGSSGDVAAPVLISHDEAYGGEGANGGGSATQASQVAATSHPVINNALLRPSPPRDAPVAMGGGGCGGRKSMRLLVWAATVCGVGALAYRTGFARGLARGRGGGKRPDRMPIATAPPGGWAGPTNQDEKFV